jgi:phosphopantetheinyl transferase (holo-ACP synthase)
MTYKKISNQLSISEFNKTIIPIRYPEYFTKTEIETYSKKKSKGSFAARYLLKKELIQNFFPDLQYTDIEILNTNSGIPTMNFPNNTSVNPVNIKFSISHTKEIVAIILVV